MIFTLIFVAVLIGALMPVQAGINAELMRFLKHPYLAALISFTVGSLALALMTLTQGFPSTELKRLTEAPPSLFIGGILGAIFVGSSIFFIPRMGATAMIAAFVTGQLLMSVIIDHYGFFNLTPQPIVLSKVVGVILLFAGLFLVVKKGA